MGEKKSDAAALPVLLSRAEILNKKDRVFDYVEVPEWAEGASVRVQSLWADERDLFELAVGDSKAKREDLHLRARLVVLGCVDEAGKPLFTLGDLEALGKKNAAPLGRIAQRVRELSGMDVSAKEAAKN